MFTFTYAAALLAVIYTVTAAALFLRDRRPLTVVFSGYMLSAAAWIGGNAAADVSYTPGALLLASDFAFAFGMLNVFFFLLFVDTLVLERFPDRARILTYGLPNLVVFLLAFTPYGIVDYAFPPGRPAEIVPGFPYTLALIVLLSALVYAGTRLYLLLMRRIAFERRRQVLFVFVGLLTTLLGQITFDLLLPLLGETRYYTLGPLTSIFFVLGCGYAITRHNFIDLRLVVHMLEQKVEERTREIRALQEEQRQMMIDLSHNLQTPLAILKTKLERMRRTMAHDGEIAGLEQSVDALSSFIYDLLGLANLERSMQEEARTDFSLSDLVEEIAEEVEVIASSRDITVRHDIEPGVQTYANRKRIREALMNLASNAVKYMRTEGTKEIRLALSRNEDEALVAVEDTGIGIAERDLPHIFERFYRGTRVYDARPGTGLGLAIVERIVREHGGTAEVASEPGKGSRFTLRLPLRKEGS